MTRKSASFNIHGLLLALAVVVVVTGIVRLVLTGGIATSNKVHITFWNGFTGPDGIVMLGIIDRFNAANPDIEVRMQRIPWATYYNKLTVAGIDGRAPAVFIVHADQLPRLRRAGFINDADEVFTGPDAPSRDDFNRIVLDRVVFDGKFSGVPLDIHSQGMYCDADMLKEAGIVDAQGHPRPPRTKEEFLEAITKMTVEAGPSQPDKQWGFALTDWTNNMMNLVPQFGGHYLDLNGNATLNCPENVRALEFITGLSRQKKVPPPSNGLGWFGFRQKRVAMVWDGVYMLGDLKRVNTFNYLGAPIPTIGDRPGASANSHVLCIRTALTTAEHEAAVRFVRYVSNHSLEWADAGQVPARISIRQRPEFQAMQVQHAFSLQIPYLMYPPKTPVLPELMLIFGQGVEHAVRQDASPQKALDDANKAVQEVIERDRLEHPDARPVQSVSATPAAGNLGPQLVTPSGRRMEVKLG